MSAGGHLSLPGTDPVGWLAAHRGSFFSHHVELLASDEAEGLRTVATDRLLDGLLRDRVEAERGEGWSPQAAGTGVVAAYGGQLAELVSWATIATGAHWLASAERARWVVGADAWPVATDLVVSDADRFGDASAEPLVLVAPDHPWAGLPLVEVEPDVDGRADRCLAALVATVTPLVEGVRDVVRAARPGLWNTVVDAVGHAVMYQEAFPLEQHHIDVARHLVARPGQPWTARPALSPLTTDLGTACLAHRGGCCLAYLGPDHDDDHEDDDLHRRFHAAFPDPPDAPHYCQDCSLRDVDDVVARLTWWRTEELRARAADPER